MPSDRPSHRSCANRHANQSGFTVLEALMVIVIVAMFVAIGGPILHERARSSRLEESVRTLAMEVTTDLLDGYSTGYRATGRGSPDSFLSTHLEVTLQKENADRRGSYENPYDSSGTAGAILNLGLLSPGSLLSPPAVLITACESCQYEVFDQQPYSSIRRLLAGSLVVQFNYHAATVDVFYVDRKGAKSAVVFRIPMT